MNKRNLYFPIMLILLSSCMVMPLNHGTYKPIERIDPVCGKSITDEKYIYQLDGVDYYFDTQDCLTKFKNDPQKYIALSHSHHKNKSNSMMVSGGILMALTMGIMMFFVIQ